MKFLKMAFIAVGFFLFFAFGMASRHYENSLYLLIYDAYKTVKPEEPLTLAEFNIDPAEISYNLLGISNNVEETRNRLTKSVILPEDMVKVEEKQIADETYELSAKLYGILVKAELNKAPGGNATCLRMYVQGHNGDPFKHDYHNEILKSSLEDGCDFLSMSMLGLGQNYGRASFPAGKYHSEEVIMPWQAAARHGNYLFYHDKNLPEMDHLALFMSPHYYIIQSIIDDYQETALMGISGGGWYTVMLAALIDKIDLSIVYAGSLPNVYRTSVHFFGDSEEVSSDLYREFNYWELYFLGSIRNEGGKPRNYHFVFNDRDSCCFMDPAASHFKAMSEEIYPRNVSVTIDRSNFHSMDVGLVMNILRSYGSIS
ncbi:MAG: hypothetical protein AB3N11_16890 [Arenibacterium sp.]